MSVHRFSREQVRALAQAEGAIIKDVPEVLFVCVHNAGRSQMAAALLDHYARGKVHVRSGRERPRGQDQPGGGGGHGRGGDRPVPRVPQAFNAVLCAIAIGGLFFVLTWKSAIYALLAAAFSVVAFAAIAVLLSPIGMPALTAPFVLTTWLFLWPKAGFRALNPVALADVTTAEHIRASYRARAAGPGVTAEPGEAN